MQNERMEQFKVYLGKHFRLFGSEKGWKNWIFAAIIALLIAPLLGSAMFVQNLPTASGCFALVSACIWIGIFNSITSICKEREIIKREHRSGLHITSYVASHMVFQLVVCFVEAVLITVITAIFLHYRTDRGLIIHPYFEYFVTYFLVIYSADVLGLAISSIVRKAETAMTVMPFVLIIQLMFSGMLFSLNGPAAKLSVLTISKWGLNSACTSADYNTLESEEKIRAGNYVITAANEYNLKITDEQLKAIEDKAVADVTKPEYSYSAGNLLLQWGQGILHVAVYGVISILALELVDYDKR